MKKILFFVTLMAAIGLVAVACSPAAAPATPTAAAPTTAAAATAAPTKAAASPVASPAAGGAGDAAAGKTVYDSKCAMCHAAQSPNKAAGATAATLSAKVVTGTGHAGGKVDLTQTEVNNLAAYLATVK